MLAEIPRGISKLEIKLEAKFAHRTPSLKKLTPKTFSEDSRLLYFLHNELP